MAIHYIENLENSMNQVKDLISIISNPQTKFVYLDTETSNLDPFTSNLLLVQIATKEDVYVIHRGNVGKKFIANIIKRINESNIMCIGHNIKFDAKIIKADTDVWLNKVYDTMIAENVLTCGIGDKMYSLAKLVEKYCSVTLSKETRLEFIDKTHEESFTEQQIQYSAYDVLYLKTIHDAQIKEAEKTNLLATFDLEMEVLTVVAEMEFRGITLDVQHWTQLAMNSEAQLRDREESVKTLLISSINTKKFKNALEFAEALAIREPIKTKKAKAILETITDPDAILTWIKNNFNVGSHKQLLTALNLAGVKTESTNEKVLNKLPKNELVEKILEFREFEKQVSTYGFNILDLINPVTGRIHTDYYTMGTATGRFSSANPNMQNLPRTGGYREGFIARDGYTLVSMDYSQQEYRLAGALSGEPKIIQAYIDGWDMHTATAASRFEKELKDVTPAERNFGKTMNFAVLYGTTEWGIKKNFSISKDEALMLLKKFFDGYPVLTAFKNKVEDMIVKLGYSITPLGRRRYFKPLPLFATPSEMEKFYAQMKREGFNMVIQGGGADVTKRALVLMGKRNTFGEAFAPVLQVHDEIVAEIRDDLVEEGIEFMRTCMKDAFQPLLGTIPAEVDYKQGKRWGK